MKVVVDTNVIVSRYINPSGTPAAVLARWEAGTLDLLTSRAILDEYERVFRYPDVRRYHRLDDEHIGHTLERFRRFSVLVTPTQSIDAVPDDPNDNMFPECAVAGGADAIVSGDRHLLALREYAGIPILAPAAFLALVREEEPDERP